MKKLLFFSIFLLFSNTVFAQYPTLLKDINTIGGESPENFINMNGIVYFTHNDDVRGTELWRTDGTEAGTYLVKDIAIGSSGSNPTSLVVFENAVYFSAKTEANGYELWKSNGTEAGTVLVIDIFYGENSSNPSKLTNCGDFLIFTANDDVHGTEIWKSDGTEAGTLMISDLTAGSASSSIGEILYAPTLFQTFIFFTKTNTTTHPYNTIYRMHYSWFGGSLSAPELIPGSTLGSTLCWFYSTLYFASNNYLNKYDGTSITTIKRFDNTVGTSGIHVFNDKFYFATTSNANGGTELWMSDGTTAETSLVKDINAGDESSYPSNFFVANNVLYFSADDGIHGIELWKTDGTTPGTTLAVDVYPGDFGSDIKFLAFNNNILYYQTLGGNGEVTKLMKYDATTAQNLQLKDFFTCCNILITKHGGAMIGNTLICSVNDDTNGIEVWKSDGTVAGTSMIKNISQGNSSPLGFKTLGSKTLFFGNQNSNPRWKYSYVTDGTPNGTFKLGNNLNMFSNGNYFKPNFTDVNGIIMFTAAQGAGDYELWKTDGTELGTSLVKNINTTTSFSNSSYPDFLINANGTLFFSADDGTNGKELWKSDGTEAGTVLIKDINPGTDGSSPKSLIYFNNFVYFVAKDNSNRRGLWRSDGTSDGTTFIKYINPPNFEEENEFVIFKNKLFFTADNSTNGQELWVSDGTAAETMLFKDINGMSGSFPKEVTATADKLYFSADGGTNIGRELWVSDGTSAGTTVINIYPDSPSLGTGSSNPQNLTLVGNTLFFSAKYLQVHNSTSNDRELRPSGGPITTYYGRELWRTEGTLATTQMVKDINQLYGSGISDYFFENFTVLGSNIYFIANNGYQGFELWKSNGTAAGTQMVNDLFQGQDDGLEPNASIHANPTSGQVFFSGTNGQNGRELWSFVYCPTSLTINTTVNTPNQKQQASSYLNSSSNIANTDFTYNKLDVLYTAGKSIELLPGFQVNSKQPYPPIFRQTVFKAEIAGCSY